MKENTLVNTYLYKFFKETTNPILKQLGKLVTANINRHTFYIKLTGFYSQIFSIDEDKLIKLSGASYLYFYTLILFDKLIDKDEQDKVSFKFLLYFQEAVKILEKLFPSDDFWNRIYKNFEELSYTKDREELIAKKGKISDQEFLEIAKEKSIMSHSIVDALIILSDDFTNEEDLKEILNLIHTAFQIRDDIDDFKKDISNNQLTLPIYQVKEFVSSKNLILNSTKQMNDVLYGSGIATKLINIAISYYDHALQISKKLYLTDLINFIEFEIKDCKSQLYEIELIKLKSIQCNKRSSDFLFNHYTITKERIIKSLETSLFYFKVNLKHNGWADFITSAGISLGWVKYFICSNLIEAGESDLVKRYLDVNNESFDSYNENTIADADTISFKIDTYLGLKLQVDKPLIEEWMSYSNNGEWTTYKSNKEFLKYLNLSNEKEMKGWMSYHKCVSSYAAYVLSKYDLNKKLFNETIDKILRDYKKIKLIESYWWSSPIYSYYYFLLSIINYKENLIEVDEIINKLIEMQEDSGCWVDDFINDSVFYTSMVVHLLIVYDFKKCSNQIKKGIMFLIKNQMSDGSWLTIHKLRIPSPEIINPNKVVKWKKGSLGTNTIVDDHNRFFTSSMVYKTIKLYYNVIWG